MAAWYLQFCNPRKAGNQGCQGTDQPFEGRKTGFIFTPQQVERTLNNCSFARFLRHVKKMLACTQICSADYFGSP
jgi:hypothetical protein